MQCDAVGITSDSGGSGADFDATQYYTRAETDTKIAAAHSIFYANEGTGTSITSAGYAGGVAWANANGCMGMIVQIEVSNTSGMNKYIQFTYGDSSSSGTPLSFTVVDGEALRFQAVIRINTYSAADKL